MTDAETSIAPAFSLEKPDFFIIGIVKVPVVTVFANTVTTGTFTIPIMKKSGFSKEKAGAIEVSASVNGQIMPPVMGAAAFVMASFIGVTYFEIVKHACFTISK